jgi:hypothetical protein
MKQKRWHKNINQVLSQQPNIIDIAQSLWKSTKLEINAFCRYKSFRKNINVLHTKITAETQLVEEQ